MKRRTGFEKTHQIELLGKLTLPDRVLFRGHLALRDPRTLGLFLARSHVRLKDFGRYAQAQTAELKAHAERLAADDLPASPCTERSCTGDRDGDGQVTIDEVIATVGNALHGCPQWYPGCGPPVEMPRPGETCPPSVPLCTTEQLGAPCSQLGSTCCQPGANCTGGWCNAPLVCSTKPPDLCPISRRSYKRDIEYLGGAARTRLYDELLAIKLASFRYKSEPSSTQPHLGFIIDDIEPSPSIDATHDRVDLYGYLSMAVASIQEQAAEITTLRQETEELRQELNRLKDVAPQRADAAKPKRSPFGDSQDAAVDAPTKE